MTASASSSSFSVIDLFDLPPAEREVFLHLARNGPADREGIAAALGVTLAAVDAALTGLVARGRLQLLPGGVAEVRLGRTTSRTTLPAQMWPALLAPQRLYSEQEIATLKTALPMLQFARAKLSEFADHGPNHVLRVKSFVTQLSYVVGLTNTERRLLRAAALFHDIGNVLSRERHHLISEEIVGTLTARGELPFTPAEARLVGLLCRWHRGEYDPTQVETLRGEPVRLGLAASLLRVGDAMDIDSRRSDYDPRHRKVLEFFYPQKLPYWTSLEDIAGVRICCRPAVTLQVFSHGRLTDNMQFTMLRDDLAGTPLGWSVEPVSLSTDPKLPSPAPNSLLACPFDAHSLVMAALSRQHLRAAGAEVDLLCYPDTPDASSWLWGEALAEPDTSGHTHLVVIGDRPDPHATGPRLDAIRRWRSQGAPVTVLNRHEAAWSELPDLLALGVHVNLGGDWAYFWGNLASDADLAWSRIAALCARDPTLAPIEVTARETAIVQGLVYAVLKTLTGHAPRDAAGWQAAAESIVDRIAADDRDFFRDQAPAFLAAFNTAGSEGRPEGRALVFDQPPGPVPQAFYWILEAAIEQHGRTQTAGVRFNRPYAVAAWADGDAVELLALNHWRDDIALPVRLLYPSDFGPPPGGSENIIHVRLPADQARPVLERLVAAINRA